MQKNELYRNNNSIIRVLEIKNNAVLVIDCINKTMPQWIGVSFFEDWTKCSDEILHEITGIELQDIKTVSPEDFKVAHQRYTMIARCKGTEFFVNNLIDRTQAQIFDFLSAVVKAYAETPFKEFPPTRESKTKRTAKKSKAM